MNIQTMRRQFQSSRAFTLVELMVVIVIIALLVAILAPSINKAIVMSGVAKTKARIQDLDRALDTFKLDNQFYPGQTGKTSTVGGVDRTPLLSAGKGSEFLARMIWTTDAPDFPKTTKYSGFDPGMLVTTNDKPKDTKYLNTVNDGFGMPILYFVANMEKTDESQFNSHAAMNNYYPGAGNLPEVKNSTFAKKHSLWDRLKDRYILIAPGPNKKYFDGEDDITN